jgi:tetratricopeptide (TPR) repeat protein
MAWRSVLAALVFGWLALAAAGTQAGCVASKLAELPVTMRGFSPLVHVRINGKDATLLLDSGASHSFLWPGAVEKFGLTDKGAPVGVSARGWLGDKAVGMTVGGAKTFDIAASHFDNVDFFVFQDDFGREVDGLLGQNLLGVADVEYDLANGVVRLFQPTGCEDTRMAYWVANQPYSVLDFVPENERDMTPTAIAAINGVPIRVVLDTGSAVSILALGRAAKAGVMPGGPGVVEAGYMGGLSRRTHVETWIGPFARLKLGDEEIRHIRLRFGDIRLPDKGEMLLGEDFFLSHRVFVSYSQRKLYFTYNGGPLFNLDAAEDPDQAQAPPPALAAAATDAYSGTPTDADGFARRGAAWTTRRDYPAAIADLTRAMALDPKNADYALWRARAEAKARRVEAAKADFDLALRLKPGDTDILLERASFHIAQKDKAAAREDLDAIDKAVGSGDDVRLKLGESYDSIGAYDQGVAEIDGWIAGHPMDPRMADALGGRCRGRALAGRDLDKALADCDAALKLFPSSADILDSRGLVRMRMGDLDGAIGDYDAALRSQPGMPPTLYARGVAQLHKGLKDKGDADITAATKLDPEIADWAKERNLSP